MGQGDLDSIRVNPRPATAHFWDWSCEASFARPEQARNSTADMAAWLKLTPMDLDSPFSQSWEKEVRGMRESLYPPYTPPDA